jgi:signal transduction histidine kinase
LITTILPELPLLNLVLHTINTQTVHVQELKLPDGRYFHVTSAGVREKDDVTAVVMVLRDVTRERQLDEIKSDFISTVSHELRTPLTPVLGFAKLIRKAFERTIRPELPADRGEAQHAAERIDQNLDILITEVDRLSKLVDDVLFLADLDAGRIKWQVEDIDVCQLLQETVDVFRTRTEDKGIRLTCQCSSGLPHLHGDAKRLSRVVYNLVSNAIKFTEQGEICVSARLFRQQEDYQTDQLPNDIANQLPAGSYVWVSVTDTGSGLSIEAQQTLFERFGQGMRDVLTEKPAGTGLGLALSKEIIDYHNGKIWVESKEGAGSTFSFVLPLAFGEQGSLTWGSQAPLPDSAPTVLVVDDQPGVRELMRFVLFRAGYKTLMAVDGPTALNMARAHNPDLIVLDIMIPGISGLDVTSVLKADEATSDIPIVILSIVADEEKAAQLGADACFSKPFDRDEFLAKVAELLDRDF